jgi:copper chaperone CopZ
MAEHNYKFNITMTCGGCSGAVERVLKKLEGNSDPVCIDTLSRSSSQPHY